MDSIAIFCAKYLIAGVLIIAAVTFYKTTKRREFIIALAVSGVIALLFTVVLDWLYFDPRPFVSQHIKPLIPHSSDNGFPSDHTVLAMTVTGVIYFYRRKFFALALVMTLAVGVGRVLVHVHSPIDIAGGLAVGIAASYFGYKISHRLLKDSKSEHGKA